MSPLGAPGPAGTPQLLGTHWAVWLQKDGSPLCAAKGVLEPLQARLPAAAASVFPRGHAVCHLGLTCACSRRVNVRLLTSQLLARASPLPGELSFCGSFRETFVLGELRHPHPEDQGPAVPVHPE